MTIKDLAWVGVVIVIALFALIIGNRNIKLAVDNKALHAKLDSVAAESVAEIHTVLLDPVMRVNAIVTAYSPDSASCYPYNDGFTATMRDASLPGVAVDPSRIPFGSIVVINGVPYPADDTGSAMRASEKVHIDLRLPTHEEALEFGRQELDVEVYLR